jgi:hypothetical protein
MRTPDLSLLVKLGSIAVHADEITENDGKNAENCDIAAIRSLLLDPEVATWIAETSAGGFLPIKRSA